jgi:hypothetical protein
LVAIAAVVLSACGSTATTGTEQFRDETNSPILAFGNEGSEAELEAAVDAVDELLVARSNEDWNAVCRQLAKSTVEKLEHVGASSTELDEASCQALLETFTELTPAQRDEDSVGNAGIRVGPRRGFLVYAGDADRVYAMPLMREGDDWKPSAITARELS